MPTEEIVLIIHGISPDPTMLPSTVSVTPAVRFGPRRNCARRVVAPSGIGASERMIVWWSNAL